MINLSQFQQRYQERKLTAETVDLITRIRSRRLQW
jgi:hypothetical protein